MMILGLFVTAGELKGGRYESKIFCKTDLREMQSNQTQGKNQNYL